MGEHDDDLEPEVSDDVEIETEHYAEVVEDDEPSGSEQGQSEQGQPDVAVDVDEDEASDTI